jgi:hypothetical protein
MVDIWNCPRLDDYHKNLDEIAYTNPLVLYVFTLPVCQTHWHTSFYMDRVSI